MFEMCICRDLNVYVSKVKVERLGQRPRILATAIFNVIILMISTKTNAAEILLTTYLNSFQVYQHIFYTYYLNCVFFISKISYEATVGASSASSNLNYTHDFVHHMVFISLIF